MTLFRVAVMWRIPAAALLGAIFLGLAVVVGDLNLNLPMSDGPRKARQAILLVLPLALSAVLLPPLSEVHTSLPRHRTHHWVTRLVFWVVMAAVCAGAWAGSGISRNFMAFEMLSTFTMTTATLFLVPKFGTRVIVGLTIAGCAWLPNGIPMGSALGFGDLTAGPLATDVATETTHGWLLVGASLAACGLASLPTRHGTRVS